MLRGLLCAQKSLTAVRRMTILKGIPSVIPPKLLYILAQMGHGDELVLADANFPAESIAAKTPGGIVRCDGTDVPTLLSAILDLMPLDPAANSCILMDMMKIHKDAGWKTPIWDTYKKIATEKEGENAKFELEERFNFYERSAKAFAVVATGESALYANIILKKGVIGSAK